MEKKRIVVSAASSSPLISNKIPTNNKPFTIEINLSPNIDISHNLNIFNWCMACGGTGKVKAMQMVMTYDRGSVRGPDTKVKCSICDGTGRK